MYTNIDIIYNISMHVFNNIENIDLLISTFLFFFFNLCFRICPSGHLVNFYNTLLLYNSWMATLSEIPSYSLPTIFL